MGSFQNLQVYQLAEKIANKIWFIVGKWNYFAKDTIGKQLVRSAVVLVLTLLKEMVVTIIKIIKDLLKLLEDRSMRRGIG